MTEQIATHEPAPGANFVVRVDLEKHGMPGRGEQLWVRQISSKRFLLHSIPFFAYGMAPGDELETDSNYVVRRVVRGSGRRVLRIAVVPDRAEQLHDWIHSVLEQLELPHEWHRVGYVAVELDDEKVPAELMSRLKEYADRGELQFEMATGPREGPLD